VAAASHQGGVLIAFDGIDGAGKTSQVNLLAQALGRAAIKCVVSKEPTDGPWGRRLRESAVTGRLSREEELELFVRDREEHLEKLIRPSLAEGKLVVLDRYFYSTIAYQGARGLDLADLDRRMRSFVVEPDAAFFLDLDPAVALTRISGSRGDIPNEFERLDNLRAVRENFAWIAERDPRVRVLDATRPVEQIHQEIVTAVVDLCDAKGIGPSAVE
jgi:dTMP kinase